MVKHSPPTCTSLCSELQVRDCVASQAACLCNAYLAAAGAGQGCHPAAEKREGLRQGCARCSRALCVSRKPTQQPWAARRQPATPLATRPPPWTRCARGSSGEAASPPGFRWLLVRCSCPVHHGPGLGSCSVAPACNPVSCCCLGCYCRWGCTTGQALGCHARRLKHVGLHAVD